MLAKWEVHAALPAQDLARARRFYAEKLALTPAEETPGGLVYRCRDSWFLLYPSGGAPSGSHTQMGWAVDDIEKEVKELKARGLVFEEYNFPAFKTVNSIAVAGPNRSAWFKDSEGNLLGLVQLGK